MYIVKRQDGFAHKPIELFHTDDLADAEKYANEYADAHPEEVKIFIDEVPGTNTRANAGGKK